MCECFKAQGVTDPVTAPMLRGPRAITPPALMRPPTAAAPVGPRAAQPGFKIRLSKSGPAPQPPKPVHIGDHPVKRYEPRKRVAHAGDAPITAKGEAERIKRPFRLDGGHMWVEWPLPRAGAIGHDGFFGEGGQKRAHGFRARLGVREKNESATVANDHATLLAQGWLRFGGCQPPRHHNIRDTTRRRRRRRPEGWFAAHIPSARAAGLRWPRLRAHLPAAYRPYCRWLSCRWIFRWLG